MKTEIIRQRGEREMKSSHKRSHTSKHFVANYLWPAPAPEGMANQIRGHGKPDSGRA